MAFCKNCGNNLPEGATFCSQCGTASNDTQAQTAQTQNTTNTNNLFEMTDVTAEYDPADVQSNKVMAVLAYFGILVLVPIFAAKESKFAKFHASQGLNLLLLSLATSILRAIICEFLPLGLLFSAISLAISVFSIMGIVFAVQGKAKKLPLVGHIEILGKIIK